MKRLPSLEPYLLIAAAALAWRAITAFAAFLVNVLLPVGPIGLQFAVRNRAHPMWDAFARWDSGWYFMVARYGYQDYVEGGRSSIAFFPVYPLMMRYLGLALGGGRVNLFLAGIIISWTAFILSMFVLYKLAKLELGDEQKALRAVVFAAVFPFAFFFGVVYTESVFLLFSITAFYAARTKQWWLVAIAGALATGTRPNGFFMVPALALVAWREVRGADRFTWLKASAAVLATLGGVAAYSLFIYSMTGHPLEWMHTMMRWNWQPGQHAPWDPLWWLAQNLATRPIEHLSSSPNAVPDLLNALAGITLICATPFIWKRFGAGYAVLIIVNLYVPLSSGFFEGTGRYSAVLFPFPIWLATIQSSSVRAGVLAIFGMFYGICLTLFTKVYPMY